MSIKKVGLFTVLFALAMCCCVFGRIYGGSVLYEIKLRFSILYFLPIVLGGGTFYLFKFCQFGKKASLLAAVIVLAVVFMFTCFPAIYVYTNYFLGNYVEITGSVKNFETSDKAESFTLNDVEFKNYAGSSLGYGYVKSRDGVIKNDNQLLYIRYINVMGRNVICYIESMI